MKELNLEVGQKVWSIQLGDCMVESLNDEYGGDLYQVNLITKDHRWCLYTKDLKQNETDACRSVFESNPFEPKLVQENEPKENKAELINALRVVYKDCPDTSLKTIARDKLQKLLESL